MVASTLACLKTDGGRVRRNRNPALRADEQGDDHEVFAVGDRTGIAARPARGLGQPGDLRISSGIVPHLSALAAGSRCARGRPFGLCRTAFGISGAARPSAEEWTFELPQSWDDPGR